MRYLTFATFLITGVAGFASDFRPFDGPRPIVAVIGSNPWAMVIGSDTPRSVIYDDRVALFARRDGVYRHQLTDEEFAELMKHIIPVVSLETLKPRFTLTNFTDQPETHFYLEANHKTVATTVYGAMPKDTKVPASTPLPGQHLPDKVPEELVGLYRFLLNLDYPHSEVWTPKYIEVMLWPYEYAPDESIKWPAEWPDLYSDRSFRRGDSYSIFLDGHLLSAIKQFARSRKPKGAVELGGLKWAIDYRYVFPSEPVWRKALKRDE